MKRMTHMEGFRMDIAATAASGVRTGQPQAVLFDYMQRDSLTYAARIVSLAIPDTEAEDGGTEGTDD
jgi:hypothetical protein